MSTKKTIVFVDDDPTVLASMKAALRGQRKYWDLVFFEDPLEALAWVRHKGADTVVTDVRMPGVNGFELIRRLVGDENTKDIPVIVITGDDEGTVKQKALDLGAADLLSKPVAIEELVARVRNAVRYKEQQDQLRHYSDNLEDLVAQKTRELNNARLDMLWRLGRAAEYRDEDTGNHILRVSLYCRALATALGLPGEEIERIFLASPLHDVGKIGIPDAILLKKGKLTPEEWSTMQTHCEIGAEILRGESVGMRAYIALQKREDDSISDFPLLETASVIALSHHEKWNGKGYPKALEGEAIPLEGRIVAIADVYDALSSDRPYKKAFPEEKVLAIMKEGEGSHFDPKIYNAFVNCLDAFRKIRRDHADHPSIVDAAPAATRYAS